MILLLNPFGAIFGIIYPMLIWSRVLLKKHTLAQAITGGVQGFFLTVGEMYLFSSLFNFNIINTLSLLDSVLYILAIITTPVILGILSYTNNSQKLFILTELFCLIMFLILTELFCLIMFLILTPLNISLIFILVSLTSILISYFAGDGFVWNKILF